ncbi:MAG: phosphotransferase [Pontixanthobacter sp.]
MEHAFPDRPEAVTAQYATDRLIEAGLLTGGHVTQVAQEPIGTGQIGDSARFTLTYDPAGAGPPTIAGKFAAADATSRQTATMMHLYRREVGFYRTCAADLPVRTPHPIAAEISEDGSAFILLMEDLGPARQGNQLASCTLADARAAIAQAAAFHGSSWGDTRILDAPWLQPDPQIRAMTRSMYPQSTATFRDRYDGDLPPELMALVVAMGDRADAIFAFDEPRRCLVHGDFRLDNMLFGIGGGAEPLAIVDWQTLYPGDGAADIGYFMGAGVGSALRRAHEDELLDLYCEEMARYDVTLTRADIAAGYRLGAIRGATTAVFSAANVVRTSRGDANFLSMARGALELMRDCDALDVLKGN